MNERIRELACRAQVGSAEFDNGINYFVSTEETFKRFAQLIIQECANIADEEKPGYLGCGYITKTKGMLIKEHFGVEE
jgi:hypothetical protein